VLAALAMIIVAAALFLPREGGGSVAMPATAPAE
jgi:hypothetical protein